MRAAEWISLVFYVVLLVVLLRQGQRRRLRAALLGVAGIGLVAAAQFAPAGLGDATASRLRDWLPCLFILIAYWQAGEFFQKPNQRLQARLLDFDVRLFARLRFPWRGAGRDSLVADYFEIAYLFCYPLIPLGVAVLYLFGLSGQSDEYWAVVLPSAYLCYGLLPFAQTLPPRMLEEERAPAGSWIRNLNLNVLHHGSIQVNTFPSAHVSAATGASLALFPLLPVAGAIFLWAAFSIAVGAVAGRYHYAADALLGAAVALGVFLVRTLFW